MRKVAVCLLSGGLDSCVAAEWARTSGYDLYLLSIDYGQVMRKELEHAKRIAAVLQPVQHRILRMEDFSRISSSSRTDADLIEYDIASRPADEIPAAYPPGRDTSFIFIASAWLETLMLEASAEMAEGAVILGTNWNDAAVFPDCKPVVYALVNEILRTGTKISVQYGKLISVATPLIEKTKAEVVRLGISLGAPLHLTWTCYEGRETACGRCDPCRLRLWAFREAGSKDPVPYRLGTPAPTQAFTSNVVDTSARGQV